MSLRKKEEVKKRSTQRSRGGKHQTLLRFLLAAGILCGTGSIFSPVNAQENFEISVGSVADWNNLSETSISGNTIKITSDLQGDLNTLKFMPPTSFCITGDSGRTLDKQETGQFFVMPVEIGEKKLSISGQNITFKNAVASSYFDYKGGAIYAYGDIFLSDTSFTFSNCKVSDVFHVIVRTYEGGAIYAKKAVNVSGTNIFTGNTVSGTRCDSVGGAISAGGSVTIDGTEVFTNNSVSGSTAKGGAIYSDRSLSITGSAEFQNNMAKGVHTTGSVDDAYGGAIYASNDITINGSAINFSGNTVDGGTSGAKGGAVGVGGNLLTINGNYNFINNSTRSHNTAGAETGYGGAIWSEKEISINGTGTFSGNSVKNGNEAYGGAVYAGSKMSISGTNVFSGNNVTASKGSGLIQNQYALGGAIYANGALTITGSNTFIDNSAVSYKTAWGGAIYSDKNDITFSGNGSSAWFANNTANGTANDIFIRQGHSVSIQDAGNYYFGSGIQTNSWLTRHGKLAISGNASVTFGSGSKNSLAGGISLSGSDLKIVLNEGNRSSGTNPESYNYSNENKATLVSGGLTADSNSVLAFDIARLGSGTYLVTKSNWSESANVMKSVSDYYQSFESSIVSTKNNTYVTVSNAVEWKALRYNKNGSLSAGEDTLAAVLKKYDNLTSGDLVVLSDNIAETGYSLINPGIDLTVKSDQENSVRTIDGSEINNFSLLCYGNSATVNNLTLTDLEISGINTSWGAISTNGTLNAHLDNTLFINNSYGLRGNSGPTNISIDGTAQFKNNSLSDISANTVQLGKSSSKSDFYFDSGIEATNSLSAVNTQAIFNSGSKTNAGNTLNLQGNADLTFIMNGANVVSDYSVNFEEGATSLTAKSVSSTGQGNSLTFVVTGAYTTANHELLAAAGDFSNVSDCIYAQLLSNLPGFVYVKYIGANNDGEKGVWIGYENGTTTSSVYRYRNGDRIDFGDTLYNATTSGPVLANNDRFYLTDDVEAVNYDGDLVLGSTNVAILSNNDNIVRTINTPDNQTAITFDGGNALYLDDIAFNGGKTVFKYSESGSGTNAGHLTLDLNNTTFKNAETGISAIKVSMSGNTVFNHNTTAIHASQVDLNGNFEFSDNTNSDIAGAAEVNLAAGGNYSFGTKVDAVTTNVYLNKNNAADSSDHGTILTAKGNVITGKTIFYLTDISSEYYLGTKSDWSEHTGNVYGAIDPSLDAAGYVFVRSIDKNGVMLRYDNGTSLVYRTVSESDSTVIGGGNTLNDAAMGASVYALADGNIFTVYGNTSEKETTNIGTSSLVIQSNQTGTMRNIEGTGLTTVLSADGGNTIKLLDIGINGGATGISALEDHNKSGTITLFGRASFQNDTADVIAQKQLTLGNGEDDTSFEFNGGIATDNLIVDKANIIFGSNSISQVDDSIYLKNSNKITITADFNKENKTLYYSQLVASNASYENDGTGKWQVETPQANQIKTAASANMILSESDDLLNELDSAFHDTYRSLLYDVYIGKTEGAYGIYSTKQDPEKIACLTGGNAPSDLIIYGDDFLDVPTFEDARRNAQQLSRESFAAAGYAHIFRMSQIDRMLTEQLTGSEQNTKNIERSVLSNSQIVRGNLFDKDNKGMASAVSRQEIWANGYGSVGNVLAGKGYAGYDFQYGGFLFGIKRGSASAEAGLFYGYGQTDFSTWTSRMKSDDHTFGIETKWDSLHGGGYTLANGLFSFCGYHGNYLRESIEDYNALLGGVSLERGWKYSCYGGRWNPYGSLQYLGYSGNSFDQNDMTVGTQKANSLRSRLGLRWTGSPNWLHQKSNLRVGADWMHEFDNTEGFFNASVNGKYAPIYGTSAGRDWLESSVGLNYILNGRIDLAGDYFILVNRYTTQQAASGTLTFKF